MLMRLCNGRGKGKVKLCARGFTLLETMIAMAIMMVAFASILMVESSSLNTTLKAKQVNVVSMLARNKMIETELDMEGKTFEEVKSEESGQFEEPFQDYKWAKKVKEIKFPALPTGGGGKKDEEGGGDAMSEMITKLVTNFFSKAIREVSVTITWKKGKGEQSFTVSTYWVNLNNDFQLSE